MFDPSAPHIIILLVVVLLLFGSTRLPGAAQALGKSMHIFKKSVKGLDDDGKPYEGSGTPQVTAASTHQLPAHQPGPDVNQQQLQDLQRQIADLQRQNSGSAPVGGPTGEAPRNQQPI
jgi:TatA/E family protein of Tat protein translocase